MWVWERLFIYSFIHFSYHSLLVQYVKQLPTASISSQDIASYPTNLQNIFDRFRISMTRIQSGVEIREVHRLKLSGKDKSHQVTMNVLLELLIGVTGGWQAIHDVLNAFLESNTAFNRHQQTEYLLLDLITEGGIEAREMKPILYNEEGEEWNKRGRSLHLAAGITFETRKPHRTRWWKGTRRFWSPEEALLHWCDGN